MLITVKCPMCKTSVDTASTSFGTFLPCPKCEETIAVPKAYIGEGVTLADFEIKEKIGNGGMGVVFLARQLSMQRDIAIKVLPPKMTSNRESVERFLKEAKMSARLEHPNIVTILDAGEDNGFYYLAMRYVQGVTLEDLLKRHCPLPEKDALSYISKVILALDFAWRHHKILHRDIKPSNVMIDTHGEIKLLDMGLAKDLLEENSMTVTGTILGTPYYMSPEQARSSNSLDFHSDMYSVGATLFHLLTGRTPFDGDGAINIMTKHITDSAPDVRTINTGISEATAKFVAKLLEKNKEDRFDSYQDVMDIITELIEGHDVEIPPSRASIPTPSASPQTTNVSRTALLIAALVTCALITGGIFVKIARNSINHPSTAQNEELNTGRPEVSEKEPAADRNHNSDRETVRKELLAINALANEGASKITKAIARCKTLQQSYASTDMIDDINKTRHQLEARYSTFKKKLLNEIKTRAWKTYKGGDPEGAINYLQNYNSALKKETAPTRRHLAKQFRKKLHAQRQAVQLKKEREQSQRLLLVKKREREFHNALNDNGLKISKALIDQDFKSALKHYSAFYKERKYENFKEEIARSFQGLGDLCNMNSIILESFRKDIGKTISVRHNKKKMVLKIVGVSNDTVNAVQEITDGDTRGRIANNFTVGDLKEQECYARLKDVPADLREVMKALLYLETDRKSKARDILSDSNLPISNILLLDIGADFDIAVTRLLSTAQLPADVKDTASLQRHFSNRIYSDIETKMIQTEANRFLSRFKSNEKAAPYIPLAKLMAKTVRQPSAQPPGTRQSK